MAETQQRRRPRPSPSHVAFAIGAFFAVVTVGSWLSSTIFGFEDSSPVSREVFGDIPDAWKVAFYTVLPILILWGAWNFSLRVRNWQRGAPDDRSTTAKNVGRRIRDFRAGVYMQTLLRDRGAGLMHSLIYFGFLGLFAVTTTSTAHAPCAPVVHCKSVLVVTCTFVHAAPPTVTLAPPAAMGRVKLPEPAKSFTPSR